MRQHATLRLTLTSAMALALLLPGCGTSRPAKFYVLSATGAGEAAASQAAERSPAVTLGLGPIVIADYLDRPQIVTRTGPNELVLAEFDRWGGSLQQNIASVLAENLSALLAADHVAVVPWDRGGPLACRLAVDITRFDATPGQSVRLRVLWTITGPEGTSARVCHESSVTEPATERRYAAIVGAMSRALGTLSREQAESVRAVLAGGGKGESPTKR